MKISTIKFLIVILLSFLLMGCEIHIDLTSEPARQADTEQPTDSVPAPSDTPAGPSIPAGWNTYRSEEYGFEISFPDDYQALDDETNLYGWTNGVVLLYNGGQSYDIALQVWNTQPEYESEFGNRMENVTVQVLNNRFLTIMNVTGEPGNEEVIATFRVIW